MKPLFISSLYHPNQVGGAEKVARIVAEGMLQHGHQPVVVTTMSCWDASQCELVIAGKGTAAYETMLRDQAPQNEEGRSGFVYEPLQDRMQAEYHELMADAGRLAR